MISNSVLKQAFQTCRHVGTLSPSATRFYSFKYRKLSIAVLQHVILTIRTGLSSLQLQGGLHARATGEGGQRQTSADMHGHACRCGFQHSWGNCSRWREVHYELPTIAMILSGHCSSVRCTAYIFLKFCFIVLDQEKLVLDILVCACLKSLKVWLSIENTP